MNVKDVLKATRFETRVNIRKLNGEKLETLEVTQCSTYSIYNSKQVMMIDPKDKLLNIYILDLEEE